MKQTQTLEVARVRGASIFKLIILGAVIGCTLIATICGVAGLFGAETLLWNGQYVTGVKGLFASPFIGMFMGLVSGCLTAALTYVGLRFYSLFRGLTLEYIPQGEKPAAETATE